MTEKKRSYPWKKALSLALFALMLVLLGWYVWTHWDEMTRLLALSPALIALLFGLGLVSALLNSLYHLSILRTYNFPLDIVDWLGVVSVSNTIAYVLPMRADLVFTAAYYKRVKNLAYTKSVSMGAGNIIFGVAFSLLEIFIALLCMGLSEGQWPLPLWALLAAGICGLSAFLWLSLRAESRLRAKLEKHRLVADVIHGFNALVRNRTLLRRLLLCMIGSNLDHLMMFMLCFSAVGQPVTLYEALFYNSIGWLVGVAAIVPGNIGIKEAVMGAATSVLGSVFSSGVAVSLLDRVIMLIVHVLMGLIFGWPVYRRFTSAAKKKESLS